MKIKAANGEEVDYSALVQIREFIKQIFNSPLARFDPAVFVDGYLQAAIIASQMHPTICVSDKNPIENVRIACNVLCDHFKKNRPS